MSKPYATQFYKSAAWIKCRTEYAKSKGGLCERCLKKGLYNPIEIVHHKVHLTPENIDNPDITMNWNNLEGLCQTCHNTEHYSVSAKQRRYFIDKDGELVFKKEDI